MRWVDVSEAIDDGRLPADADADSWRWLLLRRREVHDQLGGPWAVLVAAVALVGTVAVGALGGPPLAWTLPAVVAVAVAIMAAVRRRRVERIDALPQPLLDARRRRRASARTRTRTRTRTPQPGARTTETRIRPRDRARHRHRSADLRRDATPEGVTAS
ncbi:hypothetical protein [Clavibacter tessellarius]|uniref:hypothetical protein n=1 Tax=Clavibacter tessellarius TaxID=31965 RepID=UPI0032466B64